MVFPFSRPEYPFEDFRSRAALYARTGRIALRMRSPNKRSRSKSNRPKTLGNIVNRVFDSSGPEGKVRGTPQQIIEKYQVLARDAQLSNDRVAAENFQQHAEHYTRLLAQAQREMQAEQEARRQQHEDRHRQSNDDRGGHERGGQERGGQERGASHGHQNHNRRDAQRAFGDTAAQGTVSARDAGSASAFSVEEGETRAEEDGLVETPESKASAPAEQPEAPAKPARKPRAPRAAAAKPKPLEAQAESVAEADGAVQAQAAPTGEPAGAAPKPARRYTRKPRQSDDATATQTSQSAAE